MYDKIEEFKRIDIRRSASRPVRRGKLQYDTRRNVTFEACSILKILYSIITVLLLIRQVALNSTTKLLIKF